jgi:exopolysaccharide/PEP-CTERM locus tyrosine autokinase
MSRIEEALRRLQEATARTSQPQSSRSGLPRSAIPISERKKVAIGGHKIHVEQSDLIEGGLLAPLDQAVAVADEFRRIKRPLIANATETRPAPAPNQNVIMIASALPGAGKTFCAVNLAVSISLERELNVLLVDADVAKPHISRAFGLEDAPGLIDLLLDETVDVGDLLVRTDVNDIQLLPAGRRHPQATELLASERMSKIVSELSTRYADRIILLDSPPLLITSEAQALAGQVGQIALVVEAGSTTEHALSQTIESLDANKAINIILNKTRHWGPGGYYGSEYYYGQSASRNGHDIHGDGPVAGRDGHGTE